MDIVGCSASAKNMRKGIEGLSESTARYLLQKNRLAFAQYDSYLEFICFFSSNKTFLNRSGKHIKASESVCFK